MSSAWLAWSLVATYCLARTNADSSMFYGSIAGGGYGHGHGYGYAYGYGRAQDLGAARAAQDCQTSDDNGITYRGFESTTVSGHKCEAWDENYNPMFPEAGLASNFCRNPDNDAGGVWCYLPEVDGFTAWEYCDVPTCGTVPPLAPAEAPASVVDELECQTEHDHGASYRGQKQTTQKGVECQAWTEAPWEGFHVIEDNFCRNPTGWPGGPWCYIETYDYGMTYDYCDVPACHDEPHEPHEWTSPPPPPPPPPRSHAYSADDCQTEQDNGTSYRGQRQTTEKGITCKPWTEGPWGIYNTFFPDAGITENFCRNPEGWPGGPWCYIETYDYGMPYDYCDVPACDDEPHEPQDWAPPPSSLVDSHAYSAEDCQTQQDNGESYRGTAHVATSGQLCKSWQDGPWESYYPTSYPDADLSENFCRNPGGSGMEGVWCYTEDYATDYCDVPKCSTDGYTPHSSDEDEHTHTHSHPHWGDHTHEEPAHEEPHTHNVTVILPH